LLEWGLAGAPIAGEIESGDLHVVAPFPQGALVAVIDGLGHGPKAAAAARVAAETLQANPGEPPLWLVQQCHERLRKTRGAVLTAASFAFGSSLMTRIGVGNVDGVLFRADAAGGPARESVITRGGVVGHELPPLRASVVPIRPGDTLILATDGIKSEFMDRLPLERDPRELANLIFDRYRKGSDDALVVVARYTPS
jgi:hypothetical protein